jgi:hypothetical protein
LWQETHLEVRRMFFCQMRGTVHGSSRCVSTGMSGRMG